MSQQLPPHSAPLSRYAMAYVLAGGRGSRLMELTDRRAKPAVYFGGKSRIIDFALSNALNSGIRRIAIATQYKAHSLIRHLQQGWNFFRTERNESFDILPASQRVSEDRWYVGTADAVFQNLDIVQDYEPKYIILLAGDHIYKMDYEIMLQQHVEQGADVTVGCLEVSKKEASGFGVMQIDETDRIIVFYKDGTYEVTGFDITNRYDADNVLLIDKFHPEKVVTAVYFDAKNKQFNVKRFLIESQTLKSRYTFIKDGEGNYLEMVTLQQEPVVIVRKGKKKTELTEEVVALHETVDITGWRTVGSHLAGEDMKELSLLPEAGEDASQREAPTLF